MAYKNKEKNAEYQKAYRSKNKERIAEYQKQYRLENRKRLSEYNRIYDISHRGGPNRRIQTWREKWPEKVRAEHSISNRIRDEKIKRRQFCEMCGATGDIHAHHPDYSRPLDVVWLCRNCHREVHKLLA